jgi:class 3 adenylate cyclase/predicted ATPase
MSQCPSCGLANAAGMWFCGRCGAALVDTPDGHVAAPGSAERRYLTVMFCDLVGSTPLAESLDPEDLRDVLVAYQDACALAIERYGGHTAQYLGDGVLAYFGYPRAHEDDPQRAVHAALAILAAVSDVNSGPIQRFDVSLHLRIAVHSGIVVAGEMGGRNSRDFQVVGETLNIAARLQDIAATDTVIVSDATHRMIDGFFDTEALGPVQLKGVSRAIQAHRVVRSSGLVNRLELADRGITPLVGRNAELGALINCWKAAATGRGAVVHICGQPGIGKSRIARALQDQLPAVSKASVWQCSAYHASSALYPVITFLERDLGLDRSAPVSEQLLLLEAALAETGLPPDDSRWLAHVLSVPMPEAEGPLASLDARAATLRVLESVLVANPARHPLLLVVEDLHWADPTTVELLGRIVARVSTIPVLAVFTFRPDFDAPWLDAADVVSLPLGHLPPAEMDRMITAATEGMAIPADTLALVVESSDGVPLFAEEMIKMLATPHDAGAGGAEASTGAGLAVPETLQGLLTMRLDALGAAREAAQLAAVLGREFAAELFYAIGAHDDPATSLDRLVAHGIVRPVDGGHDRYEFSHALLHEAAYGSMLRRQRQEHHMAAARALSVGSTPLADRQPELVAHHYSQAGAHADAVHHWREAGLRAMAGAAFIEAADHFSRGVSDIEHLASSDERDRTLVELLTYLGACRQAGHGYAATGVDEIYARARSVCGRVGSLTQLLSVIRGQYLFHCVHADYAIGLDLANEMLSMGRLNDDRRTLVEAHLYGGLAHMYLANFAPSRSHFEQAIELYWQPDRPEPIYQALGDAGPMALAYLASVLWTTGHPEESLVRSDESLALAEELAEPMTLAQTWGMRALLHGARHEFADMARWADRTHTFAADRGIAYWLHLSALLRHSARARTEGLGEGIERVSESLDDYTATGARLGLPDFLLVLASLHLAAGDPGEAMKVIERAEQHIAATGERYSYSFVLRAKGDVLLALDPGDPGPPEACYRDAIAVARAQGARLPELRAATSLMRLRRDEGDIGDARDALLTCCASFSASDIDDVRRARALLADG